MRFAVISDGFWFQQWQADAIRQLILHGHVMALMITGDHVAQTRSGLKGFRQKKSGTFLFSVLENRFFAPPARIRVSLHHQLENVPWMKCRVIREKNVWRFQDEDIRRIMEKDADFILRFAMGILKGGILEAARFGVWSFHHGDEMKYRGGPAGFHEIINGDPVTGAILQRLTERLDGGTILRKGFLKTSLHSWKENLQQLYTVSSAWPALVADEIESLPDPERSRFGKKSTTTAPVYRVPGNGLMLSFLVRLLYYRIRFLLEKYFIMEEWNVGIVRKQADQLLLPQELSEKIQPEWLPPLPKGRYLADPFGVVEGDFLHLLAEQYDYKRLFGEIRACRIDISRSGQLISHREINVFKAQDEKIHGFGSGIHRSYPCLMQESGTWYCVPEAWQSGNITLYRTDPSFRHMEQVKVLVTNISAVDPTLTFHQGRWWLFFTTREHSNSHLHIWYADHLTGEYHPHRLNPVKVDVRSARPAGTPFRAKGRLFRPAQDCSVTYGYRVAVNQILTLTPELFEEETLHYIGPLTNGPYRQGLHTVSMAGPVTLIDGKKLRISFAHAWRQISRKLCNHTAI